MTMNTNTLALLPEGILTVAGIVVMMAEPVLKPGASRKVLGWLAIFATALSVAASLIQLKTFDQTGRIMAFSNSIQVDPFSIFFHLLIASVVILSLIHI